MAKKEIEKKELERLMREKERVEEKKLVKKKGNAYRESSLYLLTGAPTPEKACDVLKGERIIFTDPAGKRGEGKIIGYWGERVVVEGKAFLFAKKRLWVPIKDVLSVITRGEDKMRKVEEGVGRLLEQIEKRKEEQEGRIKAMEIAAMASPLLRFAERNERQLGRILCAANVKIGRYKKMNAMSKVVVLKKGLKRLDGLMEEAG